MANIPHADLKQIVNEANAEVNAAMNALVDAAQSAIVLSNLAPECRSDYTRTARQLLDFVQQISEWGDTNDFSGDWEE